MLTIRRRGKAGIFHCRGTVRVGKKTRCVKEHTTGCDRREDAEAYRAKLQAEIQHVLAYGATGRARVVTFADAGFLYLNRPGGLHPNDVWRLKQLNEFLGNVPIADILGEEGWSTFKASRCAGLAPATVDRFRATLQAALNHAAAEWSIAVPRIPKVKFRNEVVRYLTRNERDRLIAAYAVHVQPVIIVLCYQGCRTQEALQLLWQHVDVHAGTLYFDRTKTGEPRTVAMHPSVREAITALWHALDKPTEGHVFLNRLGVPYADTRDYKLPGGNPLRQAHATACKRAKIENFRVHDWRHHWASSCVMSGVDLETLRRMGGWKSLRMVERYAAVSTEHMHAAIAKVA